MQLSLALFVVVSALANASAQSAPPSTREVDIDSRPRGAAVRIDDPAGATIGLTPLRHVRLTEGWHTIYFSRAGYIPQDLRAQVTAAIPFYRAVLQRAASLRVSASVVGATVSVDGNDVGSTPIDIDGLRAGSHSIEVRVEGRTFRATVRLRAGSNPELHATLGP